MKLLLLVKLHTQTVGMSSAYWCALLLYLSYIIYLNALTLNALSLFQSRNIAAATKRIV